MRPLPSAHTFLPTSRVAAPSEPRGFERTWWTLPVTTAGAARTGLPRRASEAAVETTINAWLGLVRAELSAGTTPATKTRRQPDTVGTIALARSLGLRPGARKPLDLQPYEQVPIDYGAALETDAALSSLIARLRDAVSRSEMGPVGDALAEDLVVAECDNDATRPCPALRPRKKRLRPTQITRLEPEERLLRSLCCSDMRPRDVPGRFRVDAALDLLSMAFKGDRIGRDPDVPGAACTPAAPIFDRAKAIKMAVAADTDPQNLRLVSRDVMLRKAPHDGAPEIAILAAQQLAPMVTDLPEPLPDGWTAVALPDGTLGYTDVAALNDLVADTACFTRNGDGEWRMRVVIRRHPWGGPG